MCKLKKQCAKFVAHCFYTKKNQNLFKILFSLKDTPAFDER